MARLDRLVTAKAVAQYAAVIGRQFPYDLLQAVSQVDAAMLQHELGRLVEAEIVYQRGVPPQATYTFKHALIQDTAYQSLLKSTRQQYHQRIAQVLEAQLPRHSGDPARAGGASLYRGGLHRPGYWLLAAGGPAGPRPLGQSGSHQPSDHGHRRCSRPCQRRPSIPSRALTLHIALGAALLMTKGHAAPEVEHAYTRARALCQQVGETPAACPGAAMGCGGFILYGRQLHTARELGEQLLRLAQRDR